MSRGKATSIPALLKETVARLGEAPAVMTGDATMSYTDIQEKVLAFAAGLVAAGVRAGERVAIWAPNRPEWIIAYLGLLEAGAVLVPINTRFKGPEAAQVLQRSRAVLLVTVTHFLGTDYVEALDRSGISLPDLRAVVVASGSTSGRSVGWSEFHGQADASHHEEVRRRAARLGSDDPADILYTSGTTGVPKGVVMTHGRTMAVAADWVDMAGLEAGDRYLQVNPYFHMFGLKAGIVASITAGAIMMPEPVLDVERVLARVQAEKVTVLPGPPTLYQSILDHPERPAYDLSSLRVAVTGASDIPVELIRRVRQDLPFSVIVSGYGLTEAGTATGTGPEDDFEAVATTVGRPRPGFQVRIVGGDGTDVPAGQPGEVLLRGPSVMLEYVDDPEATASALSPEGWLRTGDLGCFDTEGRLRIVGRLKDMFIVGGFNVYPAEVENILLRHPDIVQAAVIGVPDDRLGEVGMAFVVARRGASVSPDGIIGWAREQMANYKVPRSVEVVGALPLNATGKVQKDQLRARVARG